MIVKNKLKLGRGILIGAFVFINVFLLNIVLHEFGHYAAAEHYGLEPEMVFELGNLGEISFSFEGVGLAYTSFIDNGNKEELAVIALMGPFVNLLLGIMFLFMFIRFRKINYLAEIGIIGIVVSIGAFLMNVLPIDGVDGSLIFGLFG